MRAPRRAKSDRKKCGMTPEESSNPDAGASGQRALAAWHGRGPGTPPSGTGATPFWSRPTLSDTVANELGSALQATAQQPLAITKLRANPRGKRTRRWPHAAGLGLRPPSALLPDPLTDEAVPAR